MVEEIFAAPARALTSGYSMILRSLADGDALQKTLGLLGQCIDFRPPVAAYSFHVVNDDDRSLQLVSSRGLPASLVRDIALIRPEAEANIYRSAAECGDQINLTDMTALSSDKDLVEHFIKSGFCGGIAYPVIDQHKKCLGIMALYQNAPGSWPSENEDARDEFLLLARLAMERHHSETMLVKSREKLKTLIDEQRRLIDHANAPIFAVNTSMQITEWNSSAAEISGFSRGETQHHNFIEEFVPEYARHELEILFTNVLRESDVSSTELPLRRKDGGEATILFSATPQRDAEGSVTGIICVGQDVTAIRNFEVEKQRRHDRIVRLNKILAELIRIPEIAQGDFDGSLQQITRATSQALGVGRASVWSLTPDNQSIECLVLWNEGDREHQLERSKLFKADYPSYFEALMSDRTLSFHDVSRSKGSKELIKDYLPKLGITSMLDAPIHSAGEIIAVLRLEHTGAQRQWRIEEETFAVSITDLLSVVFEAANRKNAEHFLRHSQKMESVGELTGGIAHDFNNILGIVMGNLEILERMLAEDETALSRIRVAIKGIERGTGITRKLLGFSRKEPHGTQLVSVNDFVENMQDIVSKSLTVSIKVTYQLAEELWLVEIDPGDLEDAILNLALNARDAMPSGGMLFVETANKVLDEGYSGRNPNGRSREFVMIAISDTGIGMTPDQVEKAFEPFFSTKPEGKGTGLGLSMVYGFMQRSGGHSKIYSEPGKGTTMRLYLPRAAPERQVVEPAVRQLSTLPQGNETILVVDDEEPLVDIAATHLEALGYQIVTAFDGPQALDILQTHGGIDLLFSDVIMPGGLDGYELAFSARKLDPTIKILLTSGFTRKREQQTHSGLDLAHALTTNLLSKPYNKRELATRIRTTLDAL